MIRTTDITNFTEYRQHLKEHHAQLKETGRPLFITNKGEAEAVVLSPELYNELADQAELPAILEMIAESERNIQEGDLMTRDEVFTAIIKKHSITDQS